MKPGDVRPWLPVALLLLQVPGCSSLSGPNSAAGTVGGSLSVQCRYEDKFRENAKYWCKNRCVWKIVETKAADREVRKGHVSIRDHRADLTFTVTLENLTESDAGTYWCGIDTPSLRDPVFRIVVSLSPAHTAAPSSVRPTSIPGLHTTLLAPTWSTATLQETPNPRQHPGPSLDSHPVADQPSKGEERSLLSNIYFLFLVFLEVPVLLSMLSAVLWVNRPQGLWVEVESAG